MILIGIFLAVNLFVVPYFAAICAEMGAELPFIAKLIFTLSSCLIQNGILFTLLYTMSFVAIIVWYCRTKPRTTET
jgi:type II secretory pathway component PulF